MVRTCVRLLAATAVVGCAGAEPVRDLDPAGIGSGSDETGVDQGESGEVDDDDFRLDLGTTEPPDDEECTAESVTPELGFQPVDVIVIMDTSDSMGAAVAATRDNINDNFAAIMEASGLDYRVIIGARYLGGICITAPLSATDCNPPPPVPAITERYFHYDHGTGSGALLPNLQSWYTSPDPHGLAPTGYMDWLREGSRKIFLLMTDGQVLPDSTAVGDDVDAFLLSVPKGHFGSPGNRQYVLHTIISMPVNEPPTQPWLPGDPLQGAGQAAQHLSVISGGWRFPLSQSDKFDVVFEQIAQGVVEETPIACAFPVPTSDAGDPVDPDTVEVEVVPADGTDPIRLSQVVDVAECTDSTFYIEAGTINLCPEVCELAQSDATERLDVLHGCDVGFVPG